MAVYAAVTPQAASVEGAATSMPTERPAMTTARDASPDSLSSSERETVVNATDGDQVVRVWTAQRKHITKLRRSDAFTETSSGYHGSTEWAEFTIPATDWNPASGAKRKRAPLTDEQRQALADRLAKARQEQK